jgi:O-antigen/teichoic acid export membrane protein
MLTSVARYALARGLPGLINFAALALFTRLLDELQYGRYTLVFAAVALGYALIVQWLSHGVLRLAAPYADRRATFLASVLRLFVPLTLATALVLVIGIGFSSDWRDVPLIVAAVGLLVAQSWHDLNLNLATADQLPVRYGWLSAMRSGGSLVLGAGAALLGWGAAGVVAGVALGGFLSGAWAYAVAWRPNRGVTPDPLLRAELFRYGVPLAGAFLLAYVISGADRFMLAAFMSPSAAGIYAPAYDLVLQSMGALLLVVNLGAYPLAVLAVERGDAALRDRQFRHHATLLVALALPAAAGIAVLAPSLSTILGPRFAPAARELLPLFALAQLLAGIKAFYLDLSFQLGRATRLQFATLAAGALVNIVLNLWLIPAYGLHGAAYATVAAHLVAFVLSWVLGRKVLPLPLPLGGMARVGAATIGMCLALALVRHAHGPVMLIAQVSLGVGVYLLLMLLFARGEPRRVLAP